MPKTARRKPPKKTHPKQPSKAELDDELAELATMLDECRLDNNATGWFTVPWNEGWNAVGLAYAMWDSTLEESLVLDMAASDFLKELLEAHRLRKPQRLSGAETYWQASELIKGMPMKGSLYATLRCLQVTISHSSGGGQVFNDLLFNAIRDEVPDQLHEELVLEYRCRDAIGTTSVLQGDAFDRQRRAFSLAWRRGLYLASYSLATMRVPS